MAIEIRPNARPDVGAERTSAENPSSVPVHFVEPEVWATTNSVGIGSLREFLRRQVNPIPHIRIGRKYLVDDEPAVEWMRREFGRGVSL